MKKLLTGVLAATALAPVAAFAADQEAQSRLERLEEIVVTAEKVQPADYQPDAQTAALLAQLEAEQK